jgi:hypothetical protein
MERQRWEGSWERDREVPQHDIADALDQPSRMLAWLLPVFAFWLLMLAALAWQLF